MLLDMDSEGRTQEHIPLRKPPTLSYHNTLQQSCVDKGHKSSFGTDQLTGFRLMRRCLACSVSGVRRRSFDLVFHSSCVSISIERVYMGDGHDATDNMHEGRKTEVM